MKTFLVITVFVNSLTLMAQSTYSNEPFQPLEPLKPLGGLDPIDNFQQDILPKEERGYEQVQPTVLATRSSPLDRAQKQPKNLRLFFDLQFMATSSNGEASFQSVPVPFVNLSRFLNVVTLNEGRSRQDILKLKQKELKELLLNSINFLEGKAKEDAIDNALLINKISQMKSEKLIYQTLKKELSSKSFARKVDFLANLLSYLNENYDYTSLKNNASDDIRVTDMEMIGAIAHSIKTGERLEAGVCRHMHQLAIKVAAAIGIENAYTVAFTTTQSGHMTLIMQDPKNPKKVVQLNYGTKSETNGLTGPEALTQNHGLPNTGITFRIFNNKSEHAITLPSELGGILNRVSGGEDQDLSPDYRSRSQFQQVGVETPYGNVRVFLTDSSLGSQESAVGGGYNLRLNYNDLFYGEYGISGFTSKRPVEAGEIKTKGAYGRTTQGVNYKFYSSSDLDASVFSELHLQGSLFCTEGMLGNCEQNFDSDGNLTSGARINYKLGDTQNETSLIFQNQMTKNFAIVNQDIVLDMPVFQFKHDTNFKLSSNFQGNIGGDITSYQVGEGIHATYGSHLGVKEKKAKVYFQLNMDGRLTPDTPIWLPDSEHSLSGILGTSIFNDGLRINLDGRKSLEMDGNYFLGIGVGGNLGN